MHHNLTRQIQRNEESRGYWHSFRDHRQQVMELLLASAAAQPGSICILGAGNCNDVDLARLMRVYHAVHLVDLDPLALEFALERQGLTDSPIQRHGGVDLNLPTLASGQTGEAPQSGVLPASIRTSTPTPWDQQSFEVVSSHCVLSQIIEAVTESGEGVDPSARSQLALAARDNHLRLMWRLLRPGGVGVLITDFVSDVTCPELRNDLTEQELATRSAQWLTSGNFFTGINPFAIRARLHEGRFGPVEPSETRLMRPWRWDHGQRQFAVAAIRYRKERLACQTALAR